MSGKWLPFPKGAALGQTSIGIFVGASEAVIKNNQVYTDGPEATALVIRGANCSVTDNRTEGMGKMSCLIGPLGKSPAKGNKLNGNIFKGFKATVADVVFEKGGDDNEVIGEAGTVSDGGVGNKIMGMSLLSK